MDLTIHIKADKSEVLKMLAPLVRQSDDEDDTELWQRLQAKYGDGEPPRSGT